MKASNYLDYSNYNDLKQRLPITHEIFKFITFNLNIYFNFTIRGIIFNVNLKKSLYNYLIF